MESYYEGVITKETLDIPGGLGENESVGQSQHLEIIVSWLH
jgi:hypothetical protein